MSAPVVENLPESKSLLASPVIRELALFVVLAVAGIVFLPLAIFLVGNEVFGAYGGDGFGHFFESILARLGNADRFAWLLVLSPYLVLQLLRMMAMAWRLTGTPRA